MDGLAQLNAILTSTNTAVMAQLVKITESMGEIQEQIKTLSTNTEPNSKYYCWIISRKLKHGRQHFPTNSSGYKDEAHYINRVGGSNKVCKWGLRTIVDKPKISLTYNIESQPDSPFNTNLAILDTGDNMHLYNRETPIMSIVKFEHTMEARLPYFSTMG